MNLRHRQYAADNEASQRRNKRGRVLKRLRGYPVADRLWFRVQKGPDCWTWQGGTDSKGYGIINVDGKGTRAHRLSWGLANGPIPGGLFVCHRCDNPPCVRPDHLFLGTNQDNVDDAYRKGHYHGRGHPTARQMPRSIHPDVAAEILRRRTAGETQQRIADALGVSRRSVQRILEGTHWTAAA